jgi:hypothetical protein
MTDHQALREDLAFLRNLAEEGRERPLVGGEILLTAGLLYGACSFITWGSAVARAPWIQSPLFFPILWFGATGVFLAVLAAMKARMPAKSSNGRAAGLVWSGAGSAIFVVVLSLMIMAYQANAWWIMGAICPVVMATYGAAWTVAGRISGRGWIQMVGAASFVMALVCAWFAREVETLFLIYGVSLLGLLAAPGLALMRQARKAA